ncbi:hypothetical protein E8E13_004244 [Curvularia kusanoi]|uniref:AB hydrolase-1 domain-containing protein n=1 Tax=Curvularia kusanoi TaxID=90978 RepID=A0A9P4T651_CURKU|nr:hypothetical protein E8E13_004244 [Curvularia kusanoi]
MPTPKQPTIVLIPGSFVHSSHYTPTLQPLISAGTKIHILDPPCYHSKKPGPAPTMQDDAAFVAEFVSRLADAGEHIVLASHSYGGLPSSESVAGLTLSERTRNGKQGGIVRLAYVTAVVPKKGNSLPETMIGGVPVPLEADEDGWLVQTDIAASTAQCFSSLPPEQGMKECEKALGTHSAGAFGSKLEYPGYKDVPASWFFCEDDRCVSPEIQETAIKTIEESWKGTEREGQKVDVTRAKCDHFPTISAQKELREWFEGLVKKETV